MIQQRDKSILESRFAIEFRQPPSPRRLTVPELCAMKMTVVRYDKARTATVFRSAIPVSANFILFIKILSTRC